MGTLRCCWEEPNVPLIIAGKIPESLGMRREGVHAMERLSTYHPKRWKLRVRRIVNDLFEVSRDATLPDALRTYPRSCPRASAPCRFPFSLRFLE